MMLRSITSCVTSVQPSSLLTCISKPTRATQENLAQKNKNNINNNGERFICIIKSQNRIYQRIIYIQILCTCTFRILFYFITNDWMIVSIVEGKNHQDLPTSLICIKLCLIQCFPFFPDLHGKDFQNSPMRMASIALSAVRHKHGQWLLFLKPSMIYKWLIDI